MVTTERITLPAHFDIEPELREQLGERAGHQRCIEGAGELLLVVHDVPQSGISRRPALFFWKRHDASWVQSSGVGLSGLADLLDRYERVIDGYVRVIDSVEDPALLYSRLRHSGPVLRSTRNLVTALEQVLRIDPDDRGMRDFRDHAREIARAAELLHTDGRLALEFRKTVLAEEQARSLTRLNLLVFTLCFLVGVFLPLLALCGLFGADMNLSGLLGFLLCLIPLLVLGIGGRLAWLARKSSRNSPEQ